MATKEKTSWADETDEFEEQQAVPSTWNRNNNQVQEKSDTQENVDNKGSDNEEQPEESNDDKGRKPRKVVPFPDEPPYTAFVGNLAYDIYREEISGFFDRRNCKVESVRLLMNKETNKAKGFGYVVFQDLDSLKRAVELNGENLLDRPLRIDVAESRNEREDPYKRRDRETRGNNRNTRYQNNRNYDRKPQYDKEQNGDKEQQEELKERPKIDIKPRTVTPTTSEESSETYQSAKVNPFGQAKPRDESLVMKKKEQEKQQRTEDEDQETAVVTEKSHEVKDNKGNKFNGRRDENKPRREGEKSSNKPKYDRSKTNKRDNKNKDKKDDKPRQIRTKEPEKQEQKSVHVSSKNIFDALEQEDD